MLDPLSIGLLGASTIGSLVDTGIGIANYGNQTANLEYQKWAQEKTWNREDTAIQRRVADLKSAGLSPVLAAGSAAQTSAPIRTEAPTLSLGIGEKMGNIGHTIKLATDIAQQKAQIANTVAQNDLIKLQADKQRIENTFLGNTLGVRQDKLNAELENLVARTGHTIESKEGVAIANKFAVASNPARLENLILQNKEKVGRIALAQVDKRLREAQVDNEIQKFAFDKVNQVAREKIALRQMSNMDVEYAAKNLAIELAKIQKEGAKIDVAKKAFDFGIWKNAGAGIKQANDVTNIIKNIMQGVGSLYK